MRKIQLVGTRRGKRALNWSDLLLFFVILLGVSVLAAFAVAWIWDAVFPPAENDRTLGPVRSAFLMSTVLTVMFARSQWKRPCDQLPTLDPRTRHGAA